MAFAGKQTGGVDGETAIVVLHKENAFMTGAAAEIEVLVAVSIYIAHGDARTILTQLVRDRRLYIIVDHILLGRLILYSQPRAHLCKKRRRCWIIVRRDGARS